MRLSPYVPFHICCKPTEGKIDKWLMTKALCLLKALLGIWIALLWVLSVKKQIFFLCSVCIWEKKSHHYNNNKKPPMFNWKINKTASVFLVVSLVWVNVMTHTCWNVSPKAEFIPSQWRLFLYTSGFSFVVSYFYWIPSCLTSSNGINLRYCTLLEVRTKFRNKAKEWMIFCFEWDSAWSLKCWNLDSCMLVNAVNGACRALQLTKCTCQP